MANIPTSTEVQARIRLKEAELKSIVEKGKALRAQGKGLEDPELKRLAAEAAYAQRSIDNNKQLLKTVQERERFLGINAPKDEITNAVQQQTGNATEAASAAVDAAKSAAASKIQDLKSQLPVQKDPRLIAKEKEAELLEKKAMVEKLILEKKEEVLNNLKAKLNSFKIPSLPALSFPPKRPIIDPKIIQALLLAKQVKNAIKERQKKTKETLKKAEKVYEYPLSPDGQQSTNTDSAENAAPTTLPLQEKTPPPSPTPQPQKPRIPAGISEEDWRRFGSEQTRTNFGDEQAVRDALQRKAARRAEIIKIQEDRVARGKAFVDYQAKRLASDPSVQPAYDNAVKVYNDMVSYLQTVRSNPNIVDLTQ